MEWLTTGYTLVNTSYLKENTFTWETWEVPEQGGSTASHMKLDWELFVCLPPVGNPKDA